MSPVAFPLRYFPLLYAVSCGIALSTTLLIALRAHLHVTTHTHCSDVLTEKQEASFRNWRYDSEFFPTISSAMGDNMPERAIWRMTLALVVPFFVASYFCLIQTYRKWETDQRRGWRLSGAFSFFVVTKVVFCFGYSYIASFEHLTYHELSFVGYIICGLGLQVVQIILTSRYKHLIPNGHGDLSLRLKYLGLIGQTTCALGVLKFFVFDHLGSCVPGAFSRSSMCEWMFAFFNLFFDGTTYLDLGSANVTVFGDRSEKETESPEVVVWHMQPSQTVLWAAEIVTSYLFIGSFVQLCAQTYFIPMVAMRFTKEAVMMVTPPLVTIAVSKLPTIQSLLRGEASLRTVITTQLWLSIASAGAAATLFHVDVVENPERKIVIAAIGAHVLLTSNRLRGLMASTKLNTVAKQIEHGGNPVADLMIKNATFDQHRLLYGLGFGFVVTILVRYWDTSLDPFFYDPIYSAFMILVILGLQLFGPIRQYAFELHLMKDDTPMAPFVLPSNSAACAFGALLVLGLTVSSSPSTIARYVAIDPLRDWWASPSVALAFLLGLYSSSHFSMTGLPNTKTGGFSMLAAFMVASVLVLYYGTTQSNRFFQRDPNVLEEWVMEPFSGSPVFAFVCGGLVLQFAIGAILPHVNAWNSGVSTDLVRDKIDEATVAHTIPRDLPVLRRVRTLDACIYGCAMLGVVGSVYTVCFPFVPAGFLLRDRMNVVLIGIVAMLLAAAATASRNFHQLWKKIRLDEDSVDIRWLCKVFGVAVIVMTARRELGKVDAPNPVVRDGETHSVNLTAAIWTIHFASDDYGVEALPRLTEFLRTSKAQVIGLLESDAHRVTNANKDIVEYITYNLGYRYSDFGPTTLDSTFGCALISQFPIHNVKRMVLPSPMGELACMIYAQLEVLPAPAPLVNVYVGHWGNTHHVQDVVLQSDLLGRLALQNDGPSFFLGYLVTHAGYKNYYRFVQSDGEEDQELRMTKDDDAKGRDDGTVVWPETQDGHRMPRIPIVKRKSGLFRDAGRDILRGVNSMSGVSQAQFDADRSKDPLTSTFPKGSYWRVRALPKWNNDNSVVFEGRVASARLQESYAESIRLTTMMKKIADGGMDTDDAPFKETQEGLSLQRLQRAAEFKARRMTRGLSNESLIDHVPATLKPALEFLENTTTWEGRSSTSMVYEFPNTGRVQLRHPRHEYEDRYCQYILYRSIPLLDWYRVLDIDELSDTELQVVTFALSTAASNS